ncbi:SBBP repeat-containing protein [Planktothricoides raciborskii]|uniref:SBBP repeat-containing protein n=2 Tax=Planktothricoides raciborskii TaxID=132608 RepID=A0AAU8J8J4_9CYAN|nr:SBBP repeat-containing protein [Planktothricoides raciborskii]MBD2547124.1 SBBP repeat-containing protein [Planktothricoides raciborskii FACHB-1370]MBD2585662.1 SBBP repeat-containing protein [Planktothricoides raciborskii FACHB-1261]
MPDQQGGNYRTQWTQQLGSQGDDYAFSIAADRLGGIYMAGLTFGDLGSSNAGIDDAWLAKYDTSGNQLWTKQLGTSEGDRAYKMNTDSAGNIYLTGTTKGILGKNSAGDWDAWIGKYDSNGNQLWIQQLGSATTDESSSTATDNAGNTYLTGATWGNLAGSNAGKWDAWIAQYDSNGNQVWAKQIGTPEEDHSYAIAVDNQGNAYLAGYTQGNLFAPNAGNWDAWIAKYDRNGNQIWGQQIGTPSEDQAKGIATDSQGNIYLTGWTEGAMSSENQGSFDAWMAKYDPNGNQLWMQQLGSAGSEGALDLTIDSEDRIYLTGNTWGDLASPNAGNNDAWAAEYNSDGNLLWKRQLGTAGEDLAFGVAVGEPGKLYIGGWTDGAFTQNSGGTDAWLAQLLPNNAPELSDISVEGKENPQITFTAENFLQAFTDSNGDSLVKVQITSLPENGSLTLNGNPVTENQEIETSQLENLKFIPTFGFTGQTSFTWNGYDGMNYAATPATANLTVSANPNEPLEIEWIRQFGSNNDDLSHGVAVDSTGNIYLTGSTLGDLGGANAGNNDAWVAKYDSQGNQLWLQQFGTNTDDYSNGVAVDDTGNVYLMGHVNFPSTEVWITKYDPEGNQLWLQQFGTNTYQFYGDITVDSAGNVYLTGVTLSDLGGATAGGNDAWVAKYDPQGNQIWLQQFGTNFYDYSGGVTVDAGDNVYLTGGTLGDLGGANAGDEDAWIAKYDSSGNQLWLQQFGTNFIDSSFDVAVDSTGNVYLTGETSGNLGGTGLGDVDAWVAKYDPQGNQLWLQQFGTNTYDSSNDVRVDAAGNVYLTGKTEKYLGGSSDLTNDRWVAKYDPEGNQIWRQQFGTGTRNASADVALDDTGNLYLTASTYGDLGGPNAGFRDAWVAKLSHNALQAPVEISGSEADDRLTGGIGNEVLLGYEGNDTLNGNGGNDTLTGVNGSDVFVLASGSGSDVITDFVDGTDMLQLAGDLTFEQLTILPGTDGTLINLGANLLATLTGIDASLITQEDFIF